MDERDGSGQETSDHGGLAMVPAVPAGAQVQRAGAAWSEDGGHDVRGDLALTARLVLRRPGLAGGAAVLGGATIVTACLLDWLLLHSMVVADARTGTAVTAGWSPLPGATLGWVLAAAGLTAVALGGATALDRPPPRGPALLGLVGGGGAITTVVLATGDAAPATRFAEQTDELTGLAERLPAGVELELSVATGVGPLVAAGGVALVLVAAIGARER